MVSGIPIVNTKLSRKVAETCGKQLAVALALEPLFKDVCNPLSVVFQDWVPLEVYFDIAHTPL